MTGYAGARMATSAPRVEWLATLRRAAEGSRGRRLLSALLWIALGAALAYFVVPELPALRDSLGALTNVEAVWLALAAALVGLRYVSATLTLQAAASQAIAFGPTLLVQLSSSFIGRLTPEGIGWLVLNQRYLERAGLPRSSAATAIALKLIAGGVARLVIVASVAALVGASGVIRVEVPSAPGFIAGALAVAAILAGAAIALRRRSSRAVAPVVSAARDLAAVVRQPRRAAVLFGNSAVLTISSGLALAASAVAVGVDVSLVSVMAVYLGGTAVASLSPTPGNIGAVEMALSAGLTAVGVPSAMAVAAVLVYRLLTFWLPIVPGFVAFRYLQRKQYI